MGASTAETPTQPDDQPDLRIRASDAERDEVVARLTEEFAAGRLSQDTFMYRVNAVLAARHQTDLPPLVADLPPGLPPAPLPPPPAPPWQAGVLRSLSSLGSAIGRLRPARRRRLGHPGRPRRARVPELLEFPRGAGDSFSIGRNRGCDLMLADLSVSRAHAQLYRTRSGWLLTDLGSTNGTRVNGWRVRGEMRVRPGDLVSFGDAVYLLCAAE